MSIPALQQPAPTLDEIVDVVLQRVGIPKDRWEVAAQLEVLGYRDVDARDLFGFDDLFAAADHILDRCRRLQPAPAMPQDEEIVRPNAFLQFLRFYADGLVFSMPMVLQGTTMLLWGYGLWGATDLDIRNGSAVALGFIASYIVTSGFAWAIVRRGLFYFYQKEGGLARWSALRMWWISARVALVLIVPGLLINAVYGVLPWSLFFVAIGYYIGLSILWLNWSLIYLVRKTAWLLLALAVSILLVIGAARGLGWPIIAANLAGLVVADASTFLIALVAVNRWGRNGAGKPAVNPPRLAVLVYSTAQVFLYGLLYSAFIFMDRILAWTATRGREDFPPYAFWLSARYELGMDLALIVIVVLAGVVEYATRRFSEMIVPAQKRIKSGDLEEFLSGFRSFFRRQAILIAVCAVIAIALAVVAYGALERMADPRLQESLRSATTLRVFWVAAVSYAVFMFALESVLVLMVLMRADLAVRAIGFALATNLAVGFIISRSIHFSGSVIGLLVGSLVLAFLARRSVRRVVSELDYYYSAAY